MKSWAIYPGSPRTQLSKTLETLPNSEINSLRLEG